MRKAKNSIIASWTFVVVSLLIIVIMNNSLFQDFRDFMMKIKLFSFLDNSSQTISNIAIGVLGSSIIAQIGNYAEYFAEKRALENKINSLYWYFSDNILSKLDSMQYDKMMELFDMGGVFYNVEKLINDYAEILFFGKLRKNICNELSVLFSAEKYGNYYIIVNEMQDVWSNSEKSKEKILKMYEKEIPILGENIKAFDKDSISEEFKCYLDNTLKNIERVQKDKENCMEEFFKEMQKEDLIKKEMIRLRDIAKKIVSDIDRPNLHRIFKSKHTELNNKNL